MKCKNCGKKLNKKSLQCPSCGADNTGFRFGGANAAMLVLALLQAALLVFMTVNLVSGSFVERCLEDKNYKKAAELIDRFGFLSGSGRTETLSAEAVRAVKQDYVDEKLGYDDASDIIATFMEMDSGSVGAMADQAADDMLEIRDARANFELGNMALENEDFESAIGYYELIGEADTKYYPLKDELTDGVYKALESCLDDMAERNSYEEVIQEIAQMRASAKTESFAKRLITAENNYLYKWIMQCEDEGNFFGENGAMNLSLWYDQKTGSTNEVGNIYMNYVNYLNEFTANGYYRTAIDKMNADFPTIENYSGILDADKFNAMRIYYANCLLESSRADGKYTGTDGMIAISRELKSYGAESDTDSMIEEYTERERQEFITWLNYERGERGLSTMKDNADLEKAAASMISDDGESIYNDVTFENNMDKYKIEYSLASSLTIMGCRDAEAFAADIENSASEFSIITEPGLNKVGAGMKFDEETETFSWFVIGIK
ncbi:MAG: hypothetical protein J6K77_04465 [Ruminococcus sp.]|nr:hypothetical protein [Ruminococcus sp.]